MHDRHYSRENDFSKAKERFVETRILTKAQGEELGWTPEAAFKNYVPTEEEKCTLSQSSHQVWNTNPNETGKNTLLRAYNQGVHVNCTLGTRMSLCLGTAKCTS